MAVINKPITKVVFGNVVTTMDSKMSTKISDKNSKKQGNLTLVDLINNLENASTEGKYTLSTQAPMTAKSVLDKFLKSKSYSVAYSIQGGLIHYLIYWGPDKKSWSAYSKYLDSNPQAKKDFQSRLTDKKKELTNTELQMIDPKLWKTYWNGRSPKSDDGQSMNFKYSIL